MPIFERFRPERQRRGGAALRILRLALAAGSLGFAPGPAAERGGRLVGGELTHVVVRGESLATIAARFGVGSTFLAKRNGLSPRARLSVGQTLRVENRHIVPLALERGILINVPQRLLFLFEKGGLFAWYPVGLGRSDWQTMTGEFEIATKERNPTWHVPVSIQKDMRRLGEPVRTDVPPGPSNPLGAYWMALSGSGCGIHGTNAPASIYGFHTHGCIRLHPDDVAELFPRVARRTPVSIVYQVALLARGADGAVFLEINPDVYRRERNPRTLVEALAAQEGVADLLDPRCVADAVASREGIARRVDRRTPSDLSEEHGPCPPPPAGRKSE